MAGVGGGVVGLLIDHDRIEAEGFQLGVLGLREGCTSIPTVLK